MRYSFETLFLLARSRATFVVIGRTEQQVCLRFDCRQGRAQFVRGVREESAFDIEAIVLTA